MVKGAQGVQVAGDIGMAGAERPGPQREASLGERDPGGGVASRMSQAAQVVQQRRLQERIRVGQARRGGRGPPVGALRGGEVRRVLVHHPQGVGCRHHGQRRLSQRRRCPVKHSAQPGGGPGEVARQPLQAGEPLLGLAPQHQAVLVRVIRQRRPGG